MRVVQVQANATLRMLGGLGPLQGVADGALTVSLAPAAGGGVRATMEYRVWGQEGGEFVQFAPAVDAVLGAQLAALKAAAETGAGPR